MTKPQLSRRDVVSRVVKLRGDVLIISGLGSPSWDVAAAGDRDSNFYLWGGMGCAGMVGLGLALAQPNRRIIVITGDGEMLMGLGSLATVGTQQPKNLAILVLDNEHYGETGMQTSHTKQGVDLAGIAKAAGFKTSQTIRDVNEVDTLIGAVHHSIGPTLVVAKVAAEPTPLVLPPRDGTYLKNRFRAHVGVLA